MLKMKYIYCVMVSQKGIQEGVLSSECYDTLEKAQEFCKSRYGVDKQVSEMFFSCDKYDYKIHVVRVK